MWKPCIGVLCGLVLLSASAAFCADFTPPIAEYDHSLGRCSITGGYVYRGTQTTLPLGAYIYGDFCTGEIFQLFPPVGGGTQTVLLDTNLALASFGEDEAGEIYVVGLGGTVDRIVAGPSSAAIQLQPVVIGLSNPLYVTHAGDASNRLFIVEQAGRIKVLQPGSATPAIFLDITARVLSGGEQGLLGLAFHPAYATNRRFFVNYTRQTDGATIVAEYQTSATDPNVANPTETILLTIAQPFANHNGGMIEFGPDDGFLYIGMGDGGAANDPGNRAQNIAELLGKILRIDVDSAGASAPYGIPVDNPFAGATPGRDEIFAVGFRNPFRFSFDRATRLLYLGDVGQGAREEVDIVTIGANYGWRVFEGTLCTNLGPAPCNSAVVQTDGGGGGCFIATVAFGSPLAREVQILRRFRDRYLLTNAPGRVVVGAYYWLSPPLARWIAEHDVLRGAARSALGPVVLWAGFSLDAPLLGLLIGPGSLAAGAALCARLHSKRRSRILHTYPSS
jgi:hypothetical protein